MGETWQQGRTAIAVLDVAQPREERGQGCPLRRGQMQVEEAPGWVCRGLPARHGNSLHPGATRQPQRV